MMSSFSFKRFLLVGLLSLLNGDWRWMQMLSIPSSPGYLNALLLEQNHLNA